MFQFNEPYIADHPIEVEVEPPLRRLKASEALRIGAALRPQCTGNVFFEGRSCAIGAMLEGAGFPYNESGGYFFVTQFDAYFPQMADFIKNIWTMNDLKGLTREQIADWLESQGL